MNCGGTSLDAGVTSIGWESHWVNAQIRRPDKAQVDQSRRPVVGRRILPPFLTATWLGHSWRSWRNRCALTLAGFRRF